MNTFIILFSMCFSIIAGAVSILPPNVGQCTQNGEFCAYFAPVDMPIESVKAYLRSASKTIRISSYNFGIPDYADILNQKAKDGVKIEYIIDYKLSFNNKVWPKLITHPNIKKYRTPVMRGGNPQMHNKIIIIDNEVVLTGSANYSMFGLVANYENIMAIRKKHIVKKYNDEVEEDRLNSIALCESFGSGNCDNGGNNWDPSMNMLLTKGSFPSDILNTTKKGCKGLSTGRGLLKQNNLPFMDNIHLCFKDKLFSEKIKTLVGKVANIERYVDGTLTSKAPDFKGKRDTQLGKKYRAYFGPEDNLEAKIIAELEKTLINPGESFAYVSTNFITNGNIAKTLVKLHEAGVRLRVFFDRGRFVDKYFKYQVPTLAKLGYFGDSKLIEDRLKELGASQKYPPNDLRNVVTVFDNTITSDYGSNHNKMAVVNSPKGLKLINGSANWSSSAVKKNGENLLIIKDKQVATIYLKEILSQLYAYRYGQMENNQGFQEEVSYLSSSAPCLKTLLAIDKGCKGMESTSQASAILALEGVPANPEHERVWAWIPQLNRNRGGAVQLYTHKYFGGKWVSAATLPANWKFTFKFLKTPKDVDVNKDGLDQAVWEWEGLGNDREFKLPSMNLHAIQGSYTWGSK